MKPNYKLFLFIICSCLLVNSTVWAGALPTAKPEDLGFSSQRLERIGTTLGADTEKGRIPGAVVLISRKGKIAYFESIGLRDKESGDKMQKDTIFPIYSMSKPIVSVGVMLLQEEGKISLTDPVSKYIPELGGLQVGVESANSATGEKTLETVPSQRDMTIQDLLRHTSGLTYGVLGKLNSVKSLYQKAEVGSFKDTLEVMTGKLGKLPLVYQPGAQWEYSYSVDVLGRLIEVVSGKTLDKYVEERILQPLQMEDTGFYVKSEKANRVAAGLKDQKTGKVPYAFDLMKLPTFLSGGGGMVSTTGDYARFLQMLLNKGALDGTRLLGRKTVEYITSDHLGALANRNDLNYLPGPGYGFGLGFAVRRHNGLSALPGTAGDYFWGGIGGTYFWVDPKEEMVVVYMMWAPTERLYYRNLLRNMVYQAIVD